MSIEHFDLEGLLKEMHECQNRMQRQITKLSLAIMETNLKLSTAMLEKSLKGLSNVRNTTKEEGTD